MLNFGNYICLFILSSNLFIIIIIITIIIISIIINIIIIIKFRMSGLHEGPSKVFFFLFFFLPTAYSPFELYSIDYPTYATLRCLSLLPRSLLFRFFFSCFALCRLPSVTFSTNLILKPIQNIIIIVNRII